VYTYTYIKIIFIAMHKPLLRGNGKVIYANNKTLARHRDIEAGRGGRVCSLGHICCTAFKKEANQFSTPLGFAIGSDACTNK